MSSEPKPRLDYSLIAIVILGIAALIYFASGRPASLRHPLYWLLEISILTIVFEELHRGKVVTFSLGAPTRQDAPVMYWINVGAHIFFACVLLFLIIAGEV